MNSRFRMVRKKENISSLWVRDNCFNGCCQYIKGKGGQHFVASWVTAILTTTSSSPENYKLYSSHENFGSYPRYLFIHRANKTIKFQLIILTFDFQSFCRCWHYGWWTSQSWKTRSSKACERTSPTTTTSGSPRRTTWLCWWRGQNTLSYIQPKYYKSNLL